MMQKTRKEAGSDAIMAKNENPFRNCSSLFYISVHRIIIILHIACEDLKKRALKYNDMKIAPQINIKRGFKPNPSYKNHKEKSISI